MAGQNENNKMIIEKFYDSFQKKDVEGMLSVYSEDVQFTDPVFGRLVGKDATAMWRMLLEKSKDLKITFGDIRANEKSGTARWEAVYSFGSADRKIHNKITARFTFKDRKIISHEDSFSFLHWAGMAFGLQGFLLGWTPGFRKKVHEETIKSFAMYKKRKRME